MRQLRPDRNASRLSFSSADQTINWAHRGGYLERPGNTMAAFRYAANDVGGGDPTGPVALELDVRTTADRELVVCHNPTTMVAETSGGSADSVTERKIASLDAALVADRSDAAYWWIDDEGDVKGRPDGDYAHRREADQKPSLRVPRLTEVLDELEPWRMTIEIKHSRGAGRACGALIAARSADQQRRLIVTSLWPHTLAAFRAKAPGVPTAPSALGILWFKLRSMVGVPPRSSRHAALQVPPRLGIRIVTDRFVRHAHAAGLRVDVWTINDREAMERLAPIVDGIMTDRPAVLAEVLQSGDVQSPG